MNSRGPSQAKVTSCCPAPALDIVGITTLVLIGDGGNPATSEVRSLPDARGFRIGAYRDDVVAQFLDTQGYRVERVDTNLQNLRKLLARRIDLWATSTAILHSGLAHPEFLARTQVLAPVRGVWVFLACHPKTAQQTLLRLRQSWASMEADGSAAQLNGRVPR